MITPVEKALLLLTFAAGLYAFWQAFWLRIRLVRKGQPEVRWDQPLRRLFLALGRVIAQLCSLENRPLPGLLHAFVFWGFVIFLLVTLDHILGGLSPSWSYLRSPGFGNYYKTIADLFALLVLIGVLGLGVRRFLLRPEPLFPPPPQRGVLVNPRAGRKETVDSLVVLGLIAGLMVTYIGLEGAEIALEELRGSPLPPTGQLLGLAFAGLSPGALTALHRFFWWSHILMVFAFLGVIPRSKHLHLLTGPINLFFRHLNPMGHLPHLKIDLENVDEETTFGVGKVEEFSWKRLFDTFSCIECGRCDDVCPAYLTEKPLSPKWLIVNTRELLLEETDRLLSGEGTSRSLVGTVISEEALWACTTCGACMEVCPMKIEQMFDIVDIRRSEVLMEGRFPTELNAAFTGMERQFNPWGLPPTDRMAWAEGLEVPTLAENPEAEILYWVGCAPSYDERAKKIARAFVRILRAAGVNFAVLGTEEKCTGDPARRAGNEYLYQMLAGENIQTLNRYGVRKIVTTCPHCFNTLKNEYPDMGGRYEVLHHTAFIARLLEENRLKLRADGLPALTFHDPCYLSRHNGLTEAPRAILQRLTTDLREMERSGKKNLCCGAGGARMWMEETIGTRINVERSREALETGAEVIATACPFCMTMMEDGVKAHEAEGRVRVRDIAELVAERLQKQPL